MERDVKHGCCSCTHYKEPLSKEPCRSCQRLHRWEDRDLAQGCGEEGRHV